MLSVQSGHPLARIELIGSRGRQVEFDAEQVAGAGAQCAPFRRKHAAPEYNIDLDLDLAGLVLDDQVRNRRTAFTRGQQDSSSPIISLRGERRPSKRLRASSRLCFKPTSTSSSNTARSGHAISIGSGMPGGVVRVLVARAVSGQSNRRAWK